MSEAPAYADILALVRDLGGKLPCDVRLPPATKIKAGMPVAALLGALRGRKNVAMTSPVFSDDGRRLDVERIALDLHDYNVWRRWEDEDAMAPDPTAVGVLIDDAVFALQILYERVELLADAIDRLQAKPIAGPKAATKQDAGHLARAISALREIESGKPACTAESSATTSDEWRAYARDLQRVARVALHDITGGTA